ncbi:MAG: anion permease [Nitrospirae bacterium]|nr:anion permease [Candidatus Troglogloeales bacterium]
MVIPVVIGIAEVSGVNPIPPALGATLGASFGFMLPISTPPNAIVYGSRLIPIRSMMRARILFDLIGGRHRKTLCSYFSTGFKKGSLRSIRCYPCW